MEQRLTSLDAKFLREIVERKCPDDAVPRVKAQRVASWSLSWPNAVCEQRGSHQRGLRLPRQKASTQRTVCLVLGREGSGMMPSLCARASFMVLVPAGVATRVSYLSHSLGYSAMSMPSRLSLGTRLEHKQSNE